MPSLSRVTPAVLTYNEEPNIGRTLGRLEWANRVVVVDSGSDDRTAEIVRSFPNTELFARRFDRPSGQWNHALEHVETEWMLALDADYQVPRELVDEISLIPDDSEANGFFVEFDYVVLGTRLTRSLYPPRQVLFRADRAEFADDGHTQRVQVGGLSGRLQHRILHDDQKPLKRWLENQADYAKREAKHLRSTRWSSLSFPDKVRRARVLGPPAVVLYCLFGKGLILDGWPGWYYTFERAAAETILSLMLIRSSRRSVSGR